MAKNYIGILRVNQKSWGKEHELSLSKQDLDKLQELLYKGWVKVALKKRREPKEDKIGYGEVWVPDGAGKSSSGASAASKDLPPLTADNNVGEKKEEETDSFDPNELEDNGGSSDVDELM